MKLVATEQKIKTLGQQDAKEVIISPTAMAYVIKSLIDLYQNPIYSVVREIASNCIDSVREKERVLNGEIPVPDDYVKKYLNTKNLKSVIELTPKNEFLGDEAAISFTDHGMGLSPGRMDKIFRQIGESNKRDTDDMIGAFGMGSKSPWTYTQTFYINTVVSEKVYTYGLTFEDGKAPQILLFGTEDVKGEYNQTTVTIPIKEFDIDSFTQAINRQLYFFENITISVEDPEKIKKYKAGKSTVEHEDFIYQKGLDIPQSILIGRVMYPFPSELTYLFKENSLKMHSDLVLRVKIGEVDLVPSREGIRLTDRSKEVIEAKVKSVANYVKEETISQISQFTPDIEKVFNSNTYADYVINKEKLSKKFAKEYVGTKSEISNIHTQSLNLNYVITDIPWSKVMNLDYARKLKGLPCFGFYSSSNNNRLFTHKSDTHAEAAKIVLQLVPKEKLSKESVEGLKEFIDGYGPSNRYDHFTTGLFKSITGSNLTGVRNRNFSTKYITNNSDASFLKKSVISIDSYAFNKACSLLPELFSEKDIESMFKGEYPVEKSDEAMNKIMQILYTFIHNTGELEENKVEAVKLNSFNPGSTYLNKGHSLDKSFLKSYATDFTLKKASKNLFTNRIRRVFSRLIEGEMLDSKDNTGKRVFTGTNFSDLEKHEYTDKEVQEFIPKLVTLDKSNKRDKVEGMALNNPKAAILLYNILVSYSNAIGYTLGSMNIIEVGKLVGDDITDALLGQFKEDGIYGKEVFLDYFKKNKFVDVNELSTTFSFKPILTRKERSKSFNYSKISSVYSDYLLLAPNIYSNVADAIENVINHIPDEGQTLKDIVKLRGHSYYGHFEDIEQLSDKSDVYWYTQSQVEVALLAEYLERYFKNDSSPRCFLTMIRVGKEFGHELRTFGFKNISEYFNPVKGKTMKQSNSVVYIATIKTLEKVHGKDFINNLASLYSFTDFIKDAVKSGVIQDKAVYEGYLSLYEFVKPLSNKGHMLDSFKQLIPFYEEVLEIVEEVSTLKEEDIANSDVLTAAETFSKMPKSFNYLTAIYTKTSLPGENLFIELLKESKMLDNWTEMQEFFSFFSTKAEEDASELPEVEQSA